MLQVPPPSLTGTITRNVILPVQSQPEQGNGNENDFPHIFKEFLLISSETCDEKSLQILLCKQTYPKNVPL